IAAAIAIFCKRVLDSPRYRERRIPTERTPCEMGGFYAGPFVIKLLPFWCALLRPASNEPLMLFTRKERELTWVLRSVIGAETIGSALCTVTPRELRVYCDPTRMACSRPPPRTSRPFLIDHTCSVRT